MNDAKECLLGYEIERRTPKECVADVIRWVKDGSGIRWLACMNPHSYIVALDDCAFSTALRAADWLIPDGIGVVMASRWLNGAIRQRVTGSDIFWGVQDELNRLGTYSVFFLGSTEETLSKIRERVARDFPNLRVVGTYAPPFAAMFSSDENEEMIEAIKAAAPDVLWVAMTAPKQEKWIFDNRARLNTKFAAAVGAVFDFYSGRVKRSHPIFQRLGLEWLPRLLQEPRRLWQRMLVSAPLFAWHVLRYGHGSARR